MDTVRRTSKRALIVAWVIAVIAAVAMAPIALIVGAFASDSGTGAAVATAYIIMLLPLVFLLTPIIPNVLHVQGKYAAARIASYALIVVALLPIAAFVFMLFSNGVI